MLPLLPAVGGLDLDDYLGTTLERFANPAIADTLARLRRRGSVKMPSYLLPSLREARERGLPCSHLVLAVAAWMRFLRGSDLRGATVEVEDPRAESLQALALRGLDYPRLLLGARSVFGTLADDRDLVQQLQRTLTTLSREGLDAALRTCTRPTDLAA